MTSGRNTAANRGARVIKIPANPLAPVEVIERGALPDLRRMTNEALAGSITLLDQARGLALLQFERAENRYQAARAEQLRRESEPRA